MSIAKIGGINGSEISGLDYISKNPESKSESVSFESVFSSAINLIKDTNELSNKAEEEEIKYSLGYDNTSELLVAQNKANISLSYTVAVRDKLLEAYKEIMNMQF